MSPQRNILANAFSYWDGQTWWKTTFNLPFNHSTRALICSGHMAAEWHTSFGLLTGNVSRGSNVSFPNYSEKLKHIAEYVQSESGSSPSHVKSGVATSWMGISFRKAGFWQRGFPLTTLVFFSHWPSQAKWQSHTYGLDRRLLWK